MRCSKRLQVFGRNLSSYQLPDINCSLETWLNIKQESNPVTFTKGSCFLFYVTIKTDCINPMPMNCSTQLIFGYRRQQVFLPLRLRQERRKEGRADPVAAVCRFTSPLLTPSPPSQRASSKCVLWLMFLLATFVRSKARVFPARSFPSSNTYLSTLVLPRLHSP